MLTLRYDGSWGRPVECDRKQAILPYDLPPKEELAVPESIETESNNLSPNFTFDRLDQRRIGRRRFSMNTQALCQTDGKT